MVAFLYDFRKGHCEYFAGAMTLLCQSLHIQRMVVGFKCDDFNPLGGYYTVRQSHAHAWVEVLTTEGWKSFDPTSGIDDDSTARADSLKQRIGDSLDYLEYTWANSVIGYDHDNRENLINKVEAGMTNAAINVSTQGAMDRLAGKSAVYLIGSTTFRIRCRLSDRWWRMMVVAMLTAVIVFLLERWKIRRRVSHIGLQALSTEEQIRLARQLRFYDDLCNCSIASRFIAPGI